MIEFKDVTKTFDVKQGAVHAVQDVNLKIEDGHIYGIVGYSGAGKSTLVRMLNGLETPTSGSVVIDDVNITTLSGAKLRAQRQKNRHDLSTFQLVVVTDRVRKYHVST